LDQEESRDSICFTAATTVSDTAATLRETSCAYDDRQSGEAARFDGMAK
jgi:hypothetical protein